jgi:AcrR family transcriptional regulator
MAKSIDNTLAIARRPSKQDTSAGLLPAVSKRPGRRNQETRTREAREKLLKATIDVLIDCGYNKLSTKEVSTRAGLSNGALVHHFSSKEDLVVAATSAVYDEAILRARVAAQSPEALKDPIGGFISHCASIYFDWPFTASLEVVMVARTDSVLMSRIEPIIHNYRTLTDEAWIAVLKQVGVPRPRAETVLSMTLNQVRGMAVGDLWPGKPADHKKALAEWASVVKQALMSRTKYSPSGFDSC